MLNRLIAAHRTGLLVLAALLALSLPAGSAGVSGIFKYDPSKDIYKPPPPGGILLKSFDKQTWVRPRRGEEWREPGKGELLSTGASLSTSPTSKVRLFMPTGELHLSGNSILHVLSSTPDSSLDGALALRIEDGQVETAFLYGEEEKFVVLEGRNDTYLAGRTRAEIDFSVEGDNVNVIEGSLARIDFDRGITWSYEPGGAKVEHRLPTRESRKQMIYATKVLVFRYESMVSSTIELPTAYNEIDEDFTDPSESGAETPGDRLIIDWNGAADEFWANQPWGDPQIQELIDGFLSQRSFQGYSFDQFGKLKIDDSPPTIPDAVRSRQKTRYQYVWDYNPVSDRMDLQTFVRELVHLRETGTSTDAEDETGGTIPSVEVTGEIPEEIPEIDKPNAEEDFNVEEKLARARALFAQGRTEEARAMYREIVERDGTVAIAHRDLGIIAYEEGSLAQAKKHLMDAEALNSDDYETLVRLGYVLDELDEDDAAIERLVDAAAINGDDFDLHLRLAQLRQQEGRLSEAVQSYTRANQIDSSSHAVHLGLGEVYETLGKQDSVYIDKALGEYDAAIAIEPDDYRAHNKKGLVLARYRNDYEGAVQEWLKVIEIMPNYAKAYRNTSRAYYVLGRYDLCVQTWETGLEKDPDYKPDTSELEMIRAAREKMGGGG